MEPEITFLTEQQIFGNRALQIFKNYGTKSPITDFSILLGSYVSTSDYTIEGDLTGSWWTKTNHMNGTYYVRRNGGRNTYYSNERIIGSRPAVSYSSIFLFTSNDKILDCGVKEVEYGRYPQTVVSYELSKRLEEAYRDKKLKETGHIFTTDSTSYEHTDLGFNYKYNTEYEFEGEKYIRYMAYSNCSKYTKEKRISTGDNVLYGDVYWVHVEPIKWLVDETSNIAVSKKVLFSGIQYSRELNHKGTFEKTEIKNFIDRYFVKEIITEKEKLEIISKGLIYNKYKNVLQLLEENEKKIFGEMIKLDHIEEAYKYAESRISKKLVQETKQKVYQKKLIDK